MTNILPNETQKTTARITEKRMTAASVKRIRDRNNAGNIYVAPGFEAIVCDSGNVVINCIDGSWVELEA